MATEVYEDSIELEIGLIEAENLRPEGGEEQRRSYPYPVLHPVPSNAVARTFPTVVLENPYLRATFVPALGGRLLRLFDKGLGVELLPAEDRLMPVSGGPRGAVLTAGVQVLLGPYERLGALAETSFQLDPPSDDEALGVWFFGMERHLSFHAHWTLPPDRAELMVAVRTLNRSFRARSYNGGLLVDPGVGELRVVDGGFLVGSLGVWPGEKPFDSAGRSTTTGSDAASRFNGGTMISRFPSSRSFRLGPRQVDNWSAGLTPILSGSLAASRAVSGAADSSVLRMRSTETRLQYKVLLLTEDGETLEAQVDLQPGAVTELSLAELSSRATEFALQDPGRNVLVQGALGHTSDPIEFWEVKLPPDCGSLLISRSTEVGDLLEMSDEALLRATDNVGLRSASLVARAMRALAQSEFARAAELLETALLFNAEDPLAWWLRAVALRHCGEIEADRAELLNAHYLAPLEPALRAEGFLSQPVAAGREPAALLKPFGDQPEAFLEVACLLLEAGLFQDSSRWIDEALRIVDLPLLRYLLAYSYLSQGRMKAEAAQQVGLAEKLPVGPPYPFRRMEMLAIAALSAEFQTESLQQLTKLASA